MQETSIQPIYAAIDIGSNTIRIVVARCWPDRLDILASDDAFVGLGASVNIDGAITLEKQDEAIRTIQLQQGLARQYHAEKTLVVATEAIRKATNRDEFLARVHAATDLTVQCISGEVEALLTFYGVTAMLDHKTSDDQVAVMDLGGGSMELVFAHNQHIDQRTSLPVGSGWLKDRYLVSDPPTAEDMATARAFLSTFFAEQKDKRGILIAPPSSSGLSLFVTGGSAQSLLLLVQHAFNQHATDIILTRDDLLQCEGLFHALSSRQLADRYHIDEKRARVLPAGALIIRTIMEHFDLSAVHVSMSGIREGLLLAYTRDGEDWQAHVEQQTMDADTDKQSENFASAGHALLTDYSSKMFSWREDVLKHEDIEAVHKMRVATRRLRAVMDAYEAICEPRKFHKVYTQIKQTADMLGQARDTDVMIEGLQQRLQRESLTDQAGIQWLIDRLNAYRTEYQEHLDAYIRGMDEATFMRQLDGCLPQKEIEHGKS
jgi:exopolyphosphatase/pppGpp-phosphohydrolase